MKSANPISCLLKSNAWQEARRKLVPTIHESMPGAKYSVLSRTSTTHVFGSLGIWNEDFQ